MKPIFAGNISTDWDVTPLQMGMKTPTNDPTPPVMSIQFTAFKLPGRMDLLGPYDPLPDHLGPKEHGLIEGLRQVF